MRKKNVSSLFYLYLLSLCFCLSAVNSVKSQTEKNDDDPVRVDTGLVNLNVCVFSPNKKIKVEPLQKREFLVFEGENPEEIKFFASAEAPFDLILLLDLSGSTVNKMKLIRKSSKRFVEAARPLDRIAIVIFANDTVVITPLTSDRKLLLKKIEDMDPPSSGTNFWDAMQFTLDTVIDKKAEDRRTAIIVMTDGVDNALPGVRGDGSKTSYEELLESVKRSESLIIPIYLDTEKEVMKDAPLMATPVSYAIARNQLAQIADESGSPLYRAEKVEDLDGVYQQVIQDLGMVYSIGYQPTNNLRDGSWRDVRVKLFNKPELRVKTKRGYYAN
jgi:VWFA-related protein